MNAAPQRSFVRRHWPTLVFVVGAALSGGGYFITKSVQEARSAARRTADR